MRDKVNKKELSFEITDNLGCLDGFVHPEEIEIISPFAEKILSRLTPLPLVDKIGSNQQLDSGSGLGTKNPTEAKK